MRRSQLATLNVITIILQCKVASKIVWPINSFFKKKQQHGIIKSIMGSTLHGGLVASSQHDHPVILSSIIVREGQESSLETLVCQYLMHTLSTDKLFCW